MREASTKNNKRVFNQTTTNHRMIHAHAHAQLPTESLPIAQHKIISFHSHMVMYSTNWNYFEMKILNKYLKYIIFICCVRKMGFQFYIFFQLK